MHKNTGFTMIEIVVVCLIISILLGIGIASYLKSSEIAKCNEAKSTLKVISTAAYDFYAENETFTGLTLAAINAQSGVNIVNNDDWTYLPAATNGGSGFTLTATRQKGPHGSGTTIILDQDYAWSGTYPYADPGNF